MNFYKRFFEIPFSKFFQNPFKNYCKVGSYGFGVTLATNVIHGLIDSDPKVNIYKNAQSFSFLVLIKSSYFGTLWPSIPFTLILNPKDFYKLGNGFERNIESHAQKFKDDLNKEN